jgi:hypothetical protein
LLHPSYWKEDWLKRSLTVVAACLLVSPAVAPGATLRVPGQVSTIELALLLSSPHDTVLVAPGTYRVNIEWPAKQGITLVSEAGPAQTVLDGSNDLQVIGIYTGVDTTTVVAGFTIRNGHAEGQ